MRSHMFYKPHPIRRVLIIIGIVLLALAVIFGAVYLAQRYQNAEHEIPVNKEPSITTLDFELDPGISYQNAVGNEIIYFYSTENLKMINHKGDLVADMSLKLSRPAISISEKYALFFDMGGKSLLSFSGSKEASAFEVDASIIMAAINKNGYILVVTKGDLHNSAVRVFNPKAEEIFKWNSGNLAVVSADIADNNKDITISAINTGGGKVQNQIIMFNIAKEKPFTNDTYEGDIAAVIRYSGSHLFCIGSDKTYIYDNYGKCIGSASYEGRDVKTFALDDNLLVLAFSGSTDTTGVAEIVSYNQKGAELGKFSMLQEYDFIDVKNGSIVVNNDRIIHMLNSHCQEKRQITLGFDLRDFAFFGSNNKAVGITASGAELIRLA